MKGSQWYIGAGGAKARAGGRDPWEGEGSKTQQKMREEPREESPWKPKRGKGRQREEGNPKEKEEGFFV